MREKNLILLLKQGDEAAFTALYRSYWGKVHNFSCLYLTSKVEVEETVQEVFIKVWESRTLLNEEENFEGFLFIVTRNIVFHQFRRSFNDRAYRETVLSAVHQDTYYGIEEELLASDLKQCIYRLISELPPRQQEVFRMSRIAHMSYREIASRLSISEKTVECHMNKALKFLRKNLILLSLFI